jgi:hypothetical protein
MIGIWGRSLATRAWCTINGQTAYAFTITQSFLLNNNAFYVRMNFLFSNMYPPWKAKYEKVDRSDTSDPQSDDETAGYPKESRVNWSHDFNRQRKLVNLLLCFLGLVILIGGLGFGYTVGQIKSATPEAHKQRHEHGHHEHHNEPQHALSRLQDGASRCFLQCRDAASYH